MSSNDNPVATTAGYTAFGLRAEAERIAPGLHLVATPIGNLKDISFRALSTLAAADAVIAEDTRVTKTLLAHYGISTPLVAYHEHNARVMRPHLIARLEAGATLALVSDAGTPLVSDPGFKLVSEALEKGVKSRRCRDHPPCSPRWSSLDCRRIASFSRAFCRIRAVHAAPASPNWRTSPARWCCSKVRAAWPRRSPTALRCWASATPRSPAN